MNRIIFVDDDPNILQGIRRMLRPMRQEWHTTFANSGDEALFHLKSEPYDAIVSDTRMPGMNGIELLSKVKDLYPNMIRIGLSGQTEEELSLLSTLSTHQQLSKPCETENLINTIKVALQQCDRISDESIKSMITTTDSLPSLPRLYNEINTVINSDAGSLKGVAELIAQDIAVSAKILQLVNSAFFGIPRHVSSAEEAVMFLGYDVVKNLVLTVKVVNEFSDIEIQKFNLNEVWERSMLMSSMARHLSKKVGLDRVNQDYAQIAGMLLEIGVLIMLRNMPEKYDKVNKIHSETGQNISIIEKNIFGCTHAEVGGALLGVWGLPDKVTDALTHHLLPSKSSDDSISPLTILHLVHVAYWQNQNLEGRTLIDTAYIETLGINESIVDWLDELSEIFFKGP